MPKELVQAKPPAKTAVLPSEPIIAKGRPNQVKPKGQAKAAKGGSITKESIEEIKKGAQKVKAYFDLHPETQNEKKRLISGGGIKKMIQTSLSHLNPYYWQEKLNNVERNLNRDEPLNNKELEKALIAREAYKKPEHRADIGDFKYMKEDSAYNYAVYRNPTENLNILSFKGTSDKHDLIPDAAITLGIQDYNASFQQARKVFEQLKDKYPGVWETAGHSLGGAKAMWVAQDQNIASNAFNPGYVSYSDDRIKTDYPNHRVFITKGDPISNSILGQELPYLKVQNAVSAINPIANHSISSFLRLFPSDINYELHNEDFEEMDDGTAAYPKPEDEKVLLEDLQKQIEDLQKPSLAQIGLNAVDLATGLPIQSGIGLLSGIGDYVNQNILGDQNIKGEPEKPSEAQLEKYKQEAEENNKIIEQQKNEPTVSSWLGNMLGNFVNSHINKATVEPENYVPNISYFGNDGNYYSDDDVRF